MDLDVFRDYIKQQITERGITQYKLAKEAGLPCRSTLYKYLKGGEISSKNLAKILNAIERTTGKKERTDQWRRKNTTPYRKIFMNKPMPRSKI